MHLYIDTVLYIETVFFGKAVLLRKEINCEGFQNNETFHGVLKLMGVTFKGQL